VGRKEREGKIGKRGGGELGPCTKGGFRRGEEKKNTTE